jgi:hypothetical protein
MSTPNTNLHVKCRTCDTQKSLRVNEANYYEWLDRRMYAQDAFPHLEASDREMLISATCGECWEEMFA